MSAETLNEETLAMAAGALLSLAFSYIPGLGERYAALTPVAKRLVMLGLLVLVACGAFGLTCLEWGVYFGLGGAGSSLACDAPGAAGLLRVLILAVLANQAAYLISPNVRSARALRKTA
jgi:hypothetical protein